MAGGKLTPRQKMINLMYLVFIAMLAMNVGKEVISGFGLMNEKFESSNLNSKQTNDQLLLALDSKAAEAKGEFAIAAQTAHKVKSLNDSFYNFINTLKEQATKGYEVDPKTGKLPYEDMDKGDNVDNWFVGEGYTKKGDEIITTIENYKSELKAILGTEKKYASIIKEVNEKFDLSDVKNKEGLKDKYLIYHFKGFPAIASIAKLSAWQNDINKVESDVYSIALGKAAVATTSYNNYEAIVILDKNVYFPGEQVSGKVVLGRYDEKTKPQSVTGARLDPSTGQAKISLTAGGIGEQNIGGQFTFVEDKKIIPLKFTGKYVVVPRPKSATVSADKMNVLYRGVPNPMSISFAGVAADKVVASAPGLKSIGGGKYMMTPGSGNEVIINVTGTLADGSKVSDKKGFRIKSLPKAVGLFRDEEESVSGSKGSLEISPLGARFTPDFGYDLPLEVTGFTFRVPGQLDIKVKGNKLNDDCKAAIAKLGKGTVVRFLKIQTKVKGTSGGESTASSVSYEIK
jgi:gliding motility-associated protein GldM